MPFQFLLWFLTEGTTTNGDYLLPFKTGVFLAKAPVQPVILRYPYRRFSPAWDSISGVSCFWNFALWNLYKLEGQLELLIADLQAEYEFVVSVAKIQGAPHISLRFANIHLVAGTPCNSSSESICKLHWSEETTCVSSLRTRNWKPKALCRKCQEADGSRGTYPFSKNQCLLLDRIEQIS